jgi:hypothetical protein
MIKISICGKMNSGKNTMAELLSYYLSDSIEEICNTGNKDLVNPVQIVAFADPIKRIVMEMFPWANKNCLWGSSSLRAEVIENAFDSNGNPLTYRQALNDQGAQGRSYNDKHWINIFDYNLDKLIGADLKPAAIICTDVRFCNEFEYLKLKEFYNIKLVRNTIKNSNHATETEQDSIELKLFDEVIYNNGSLPELEASVKETAAKIALSYAKGFAK